MRSFALPGVANSSVQMSQLGFGCSALLGRSSRRESFLALNTAFESGVTFFDAARSYGYGASEGLLGNFLVNGGASRRGQVVLATKFGILPVARNWKQIVKPMARAAVRLVPSLREAAHRHASNQFNTNQFSLAALQSSLETSLRQLKTDYVDILFLHEPPAGVLDHDDLFAALHKLVDEGKVLKLGIAGSDEVTEQVFAKPPAGVSAAVFTLSLANMSFGEKAAKQKDMLLLANRPFACPEGVAGTRARIAKLAQDERLDATLREKLAADDPQVMPELVFGLALNGTGVTSIVPTMMLPAHIHSNVKAIEESRFTAEDLAAIRKAL